MAPFCKRGTYTEAIYTAFFDENGIARAIVRALYEKRGLVFDEDAVFDVHAYRESQYDKLAETVRAALDMELIYRILEEGI